MAAENKENPRPLPPSISKPQPMVTINIKSLVMGIGDQKLSIKTEVFMIHKDFICYYSPFFEAAFNGNFKEGQTQCMNLDDVDPVIFGLIVTWTYYQKIDRPVFRTELGEYVEIDKLVKLWILGERFLMTAMQNAAMDMIHSCFIDGGKYTKNLRDSFLLASNHGKNNLLEKILVRGVAWANDELFNLCTQHMPLTMIVLVMQELRIKDQVMLSRIRVKKLGPSSEFHIQIPKGK